MGTQLNMHQDGSPQVIPVTITEVTADTVTLDANHVLAGQDLVFEVELVGVK